MTESDPRSANPPAKPAIRCQRTEQEYDCTAHLRCPYCYGGEVEVRSGDHKTFCDYNSEKDPISFGFPRHSERWAHG